SKPPRLARAPGRGSGHVAARGARAADPRGRRQSSHRVPYVGSAGELPRLRRWLVPPGLRARSQFGYRLSLWPRRKARAAGAGIDRAQAGHPGGQRAQRRHCIQGGRADAADRLPRAHRCGHPASLRELCAAGGGNVTGMAQSVEGVTGKLVDVALEVIPGARRIGFLSNPRGASMPLFVESVDVAARARGIAVLTEEVATGGGLASAFDRFGKQGAQAVIVPVNGLFFSQGMQIAQLALAARLPTVGAERRYIEAGLLASYGIDQRESYRRGASYVDRILKGAKPADLPIEFPTRIELTINLKTAKALGLDLPPSLITRADEVIE